jgi:DNA-directed RNA polymerase sigma subunit (sigma70/sigma32)
MMCYLTWLRNASIFRKVSSQLKIARIIVHAVFNHTIIQIIHFGARHVNEVMPPAEIIILT